MASQTRPHVSGENSFVIVANNVGPNMNIIRPSNRPVTITPLSAAQQAALRPIQPQVQVQVRLIKKVLIKATSKGGTITSKTKDKTFTLRNINPTEVVALKDLKSLIKKQLESDITDKDFDVGFFQDNATVTEEARKTYQISGISYLLEKTSYSGVMAWLTRL